MSPNGRGACRSAAKWAESAKDRGVSNELNTLLTALYVDLDDRILPALGRSRARRSGRNRSGRKPVLSDAELRVRVRVHSRVFHTDPIRADALPTPATLSERGVLLLLQAGAVAVVAIASMSPGFVVRPACRGYLRACR